MELTPNERLEHWLAHKLPREAFSRLSLGKQIIIRRNRIGIMGKVAAQYKR